MVALILSGAARETSAVVVGAKKIQPMFEARWNATAQASEARPVAPAATLSAASSRVEAPKIQLPIAILVNSLGSRPRRLCQLQNISTSGMQANGASPSSDCSHGTGIVQLPKVRFTWSRTQML